MPVNTADLLPGGGGGNNPGGLVSSSGEGYLSASTTGFAVSPVFNFGASEVSLGLYRSAASNIALSYGTLVLPSGASAIGAVLVGAGAGTSPTLAFSDNSLGFYRSAVSTVALSYGTLALHTQSCRLSLRTVANPNASIVGELMIVFQASGVSLIYSSGATIYSITSSSLSAVAP